MDFGRNRLSWVGNAAVQAKRPVAVPSGLSSTSWNQKGDAAPRLCGELWMIRRFTSARNQRVQSKRTIQVQAITAYAGWHCGISIATDLTGPDGVAVG